MALPSSRAEFRQFILEQLGDPVLKINVADEQIENQIDIALSYYADYHVDGTQRLFYKSQITANLMSDAIHHLTIVNGGTGYANTDSVTFSAPGSNATASITTNSNGVITSANLLTNGQDFANAPTVTVTSNTGSNSSISATIGGYIEIPENVIGVGRIFPFSFLTASSSDMFSVQYQFALNNIYTLSNSQLAPWYMSLQHLQLFQEVLVGRTPFRYNRNANKLYIDSMKQRLKIGEYIVFEAYQVLDPETFPDVWKDRYLIRYATALLKKQWGINLKKFQGTKLPGGVEFSGQLMYDEAVQEIKDLEQEMLNSWSVPVLDICAVLSPFILFGYSYSYLMDNISWIA